MPDTMSRYGMKATGNPDFAFVFRGAKGVYDGLRDELGLLDEIALAGYAYPITITAANGRKGSDPFSTLWVTVQEPTAGADGIQQTKRIKLRCDPDKASAAQRSLKGKTLTLGDNDSASTRSWIVIAVAIC